MSDDNVCTMRWQCLCCLTSVRVMTWSAVDDSVCVMRWSVVWWVSVLWHDMLLMTVFMSWPWSAVWQQWQRSESCLCHWVSSQGHPDLWSAAHNRTLHNNKIIQYYKSVKIPIIWMVPQTNNLRKRFPKISIKWPRKCEQYIKTSITDLWISAQL